MGLTLDNQTLLYIIIGLFIIQIFVIRYYVQSTVESRIQSNNKKVTKSFTGCIDTTFDKYVGKRSHPRYQKVHRTEQKKRQPVNMNEGIDSIEDPADNEENEPTGEKVQEENEENEDNNEEQEECVTDDN